MENLVALKKVLDKNVRSLKEIPGVKDVGYGFKYKDGKCTDTIAIVVLVSRKMSLDDLAEEDKIPDNIEGIPVDVIEVQSHLQTCCQDPYHSSSELLGGISISVEKHLSSGGTMGAIVYENETERPMGLTNYHVLFHHGLLNSNKAGDRIVQPAFSRITVTSVIGTLARGNKQLDCAVFYLNNSRTISINETLNCISGKINGTMEPEVGIKVMKTGARTNVTYGIISYVGQDYFTVIPNPAKPANNNEISGHGDSGAIWITDNNENIAIGLHNRGETARNVKEEWAGAIKISKVLKEMNVHFR